MRFFISGETGKVDSLHTLINRHFVSSTNPVLFVKSRRNMAEILPIRRKTRSNQSLFVMECNIKKDNSVIFSRCFTWEVGGLILE